MVFLFSLKLMSIALCMPNYELMRKENNQLRYHFRNNSGGHGFFFNKISTFGAFLLQFSNKWEKEKL